MAKAAKDGKSKGKAGDGNSSQGSSEAQDTEGAAGQELARDNFVGLDALATATKELQEQGEVGKVAELEECLAAGPQALKQRTSRCAADE